MNRQQVEQVLDEFVRPVMNADGGDLKLEKVTPTGTVSVYFTGRCAGCPGADLTLEALVTRFLTEKIPQVSKVVVVNWHLPASEIEEIQNKGEKPLAGEEEKSSKTNSDKSKAEAKADDIETDADGDETEAQSKKAPKEAEKNSEPDEPNRD